VQHLTDAFGDAIEISGDEAGMHLSVLLPDSRDDRELSDRAIDYKLALWPLSRSYLQRPRQGFILGFGGLTLKEIPPAVQSLRQLLVIR
jgi:GntR family transcriptional regulator/MocR family aminotransferase